MFAGCCSAEQACCCVSLSPQPTLLFDTSPSAACGLWDSKKASPYSIAERRVPELIPVFGSQPAGDVSHKPGGRLPLLSARPAVTRASLKRAATSFAVGEQRHDGCEQFA